MKLKIATGYFGLASMFTVIVLMLIGTGTIDPDPLDSALLFGLILNIGVIIAGFAIWQEVPRIGEFNDKLRVLGLVAMGSIFLIPFVVLINFYVGFALVLGTGIFLAGLLPHKTTQQLKIKLSLIGTGLIPIFVVGISALFVLFQEQTNLFVEEDDLVPVLTIIYGLGYGIVIYGITEIRRYLAGSGFVGDDSELMYQDNSNQDD